MKESKQRRKKWKKQEKNKRKRNWNHKQGEEGTTQKKMGSWKDEKEGGKEI